MEEKEFLLNLLKLTDGLINNDVSIISTIVSDINLGVLTDVQVRKIKDTISSFIYSSQSEINTTLKSIINNIKALNKEYLIALLEIKEISSTNDPIISKELIKSKLNDTTIIFDNNNDKTNYYSLLINLSINLKDSDLIKLAIDKTSEMWSPIETDLLNMRTNKIIKIRRLCEDEIINNFHSSCLGEDHLFDCDRDSQLCIQGLVAKATLLASNVPMEDTSLEWKYTGEPICYDWTITQVLTLGGDLYTHLTNCKKRYENLRIYINSLTDIDIINSVVWDTVIPN
ncbi:MAG: hypothetical protein ACI8WT_002801 [Clostridium sp.]|jgi:hypothetical protein